MNTREGFSLLLGLLVMALLLLATLVTAAILTVESRVSYVSKEQRQLRSAAETAAGWALAEVTRTLGPDRASTAVLADRGLLVTGPQSVEALTGVASDLRLSWRIVELAQGWDEQAALLVAARASPWAKSRAGRQLLPAGPLPAPPTGLLAQALVMGDRESYVALSGRASPAGSTWGSCGLLTDPVRGGWKANLAAPPMLAREVGPALATRLLSPPAAFAADAAKGLAPSTLSFPPYGLTHAPVLADFRLSLGLFNSRSDGRHRLRFHGLGRWWNPSAAPLLAASNHNLYLIEIEGAPEIQVTNVTTGSTFTVYLDDCPQADFGIFSQGLREQGLWLWGQVSDSRTCGMSRRGLLPGEVYGFIGPDPLVQPQGLSRILTLTTWRLDDSPHPTSWQRPSPEVFTSTDRIEINVRFRGPVTLKLRPAAGVPPVDQAIRDYVNAPQIVIANIPFPDFLLETSGADYSRPDSAGYVMGERRACLQLRLRERPLGAWLAGARTGALLKTHWDLAVSADAAEWELAHPLVAILDAQEWPAGPADGVLWDRLANKHAEDELAAFARLPLRTIPSSPLVSAAGLRVLLPVADLSWTRGLDAAFVAAPSPESRPFVASENPRLVSLDARVSLTAADLIAPNVAECLGVAGAFNVNSRDVAAWERMLTAAPADWAADLGGPIAEAPLKGPWLATLAHGAQLAPYGVGGGINLTDERLEALDSEALAVVAAQQGVRSPSAATWRRLAEEIVQAQPAHGWPYASVEAFVRSGLLTKALQRAEVNRSLGTGLADAPATINASDLIEAWAPYLVVRGDTFLVIGRATSARGDASVEVEWLVQRTPQEHTPARFGRRFKVIRARIRNL